MVPRAQPAHQQTPVVVLRRAAATYFDGMIGAGSTSVPPSFEPGHNPCWAGDAGGWHCLPGFLILGVYQSGVRDLYVRMARHPGVVQRPATAPSFYSQVHPTWMEYMRELDRSAHEAHGKDGKLLGEASAVTFHFVWVHQEKFNQPYVTAMGKFWRACNARSAAEKAAVPHRECMASRMAEAREADAALARTAGMPMSPDRGEIAQERTFSVPRLVRAA